MKKSVLFLGMLLGTAVVFGQPANNTPQVMYPVQKTDQKYSVTTKLNMSKDQAFKGTPFTKATPFYTFTFNSIDSLLIGQISPGNISPVAKGQFVWMADSSKNAFYNSKTWVAATSTNVQKDVAHYRFARYINSNTLGDGLLMVSPMDNYTDWPASWPAGDEVSGLKYNTYAQLKNPISTIGITGAIDVQFFQLLMRFNNDKYFLEWSTDQTTWDSIEFNKRGLELEGNVFYRFTQRVTLPPAASGQATLYLRFRYTAEAEGGQPAGYAWIIDDLTLTQAPEGRIIADKQTFSDGGYHFVPANMKLPGITWYSYARSTGTDDAVNAAATVSIPEIPSLSGISNLMPTMPFSQYNPFAISDSTFTIIDPHIIGDTLDTVRLISQQHLVFPTNPTTPQYTITSRIQANNADPFYFRDTFLVRVSGTDTLKRSWGRDNGFLSDGAKFNMAFDNDFIVHEDEYTQSSAYTVCLAYTLDQGANTGEFVDGIWANGIEMVSSQYSDAGAGLVVRLVKDSSTNDGYVSFLTKALNLDPDGNNQYSVKLADIPQVPQNSFLSNPPTFFVPFYQPVKLEPGTTYRACYNPYEDNTIFMLGADGMGNTRVPNFTTGRAWNMYIRTTSAQNDLEVATSAQTPMIRLVVGTKMSIKDNSITKAPSFKLRNYPNPVKENTTIEYTLSNNGNVTIEVRDLMGRIVVSKNIGVQTTGTHTYNLDATKLANGTYFYSINVNGSIQTKKLVIAK